MVNNVYIHIPFCRNICTYCDFSKMFYNEEMISNYLNSLEKEINKTYKNDAIETLYVGGGTPSCLNKKHLEKWIIFTDYVSEEEKIALMQGALAFCFPSLYEGFGLPPMEAMACGTPVITSCTSSLDEVAGEAALKVNPESVQQIASALTKMHREEDVRQKLIEKGRKQAAKYTWENASDALYKVFENILENEV